MQLLVADFETYYSADYSLSKKGMTTQKYILDPRFKAHGCGIKIITGPKATKATWVTAKHLPAVFGRIDWANTAMVGHNLPFDGAILAWRYGIQPAMYIDTLALARAQIGANSAKHGLDALGMLLLGSGKPEGLSATRGLVDLPPHIERQLGLYCEDDCDKTHGLLKLLMPGMTKTELKALDWTIRTFCNPKFMLDSEVLGQYLIKLDQDKADALASVGMTDRDTLNSAERFADALRALGVEPPMKPSPKKKNPDGSAMMTYAFAKTDKGLKELLDHDNLGVQALVAARLEIKSTNEENKTRAYLESAELGGAWPVSLKYSGAMNTQRFSGDSGGGGNPQNLGRTSPVRMAIEAPPGHKIVAADLSQIECRITLQLAVYWYLWNRTNDMPERCMEMDALDTLREGDERKRLNPGVKFEDGIGDIYCWFGSMIYGRPITQKDKVERQVSKAAVLGLGFGMGWKRFLEHCREQGVPMDEANAKRIVTLYRKTFPNVVKSWKASLQQLSDLMSGLCIPAFRYKIDPNGVKSAANAFNILTPANDPIFNQTALRMPNGQYIKYPQLQGVQNGNRSEWHYINRGKKTFIHPGKCMENAVQALAGLIMREQLVALVDLGVSVELSVHDELVALCEDTPEMIEWLVNTMTWVMTQPVAFMPELPVAIELKTGYRYGECH
jgi:DNA polymerase